MKHSLLHLTVAMSMMAPLFACGSSDKLQSTNAGDNDSIVAATDTVEQAVLTENVVEEATARDTTVVANDTVTVGQTDQEADEAAGARYDHDLDILEQSIEHIVEISPRVSDGDPEAAVRMANALNRAKSRLNALKSSADKLTDAQRQRMSTLASTLSTLK